MPRKKSKQDRARTRESNKRDKSRTRTAGLAGIGAAYFGANYFGRAQADLEADGATTFEVGGRELDKLSTAGGLAAVAMALFPMKSKTLTAVVQFAGVSAMSVSRGVSSHKLRTAEIAAGG